MASDLPLCRASVRAAFQAEQFDIAYQPILDARTLAPVACEALLRWRHPTRGAQAPCDFVPIMERSEFADAVGSWMLGEVAQQAREWDLQGLPTLRMGLNVAATQLFAPDFPACVEQALQLAGLHPARLSLEISQDALHARDDARQALGRLTDLGVGIELDDFGGGPSTLARLAALGLRGFKLDRRFIHGLAGNHPGANADVGLLAELARKLGLRCTAESVQTHAEFETLRGLGITEMQGHLFCAAVAPPDLERFLRGQAASAPGTEPAVGGTGRA